MEGGEHKCKRGEKGSDVCEIQLVTMGEIKGKE
jgi:hypothetical protein